MTTPATPTGWFLAQNAAINDGNPTAAARWYAPDLLAEVWNPDTKAWVERRIWLDLAEDTGWVESTEQDVQAFTGQAV